MQNITLERVIQTLNKLGYPVYEKGDFNINLVAIRSNENNKSGQSVNNKFNDLTVVFYKQAGKWVFKTWQCTTVPGDDYFLNPFNKDFGTAIMVPGHYKGVYQLGVHFGKPALQQVGVLSLYRDNNKNGIIDLDPATIQKTAYSACNWHYSNAVARQKNAVDNWSAGCGVLAYGYNEAQYQDFIACFSQAINFYKWPNSFSLSLINEYELV